MIMRKHLAGLALTALAAGAGLGAQETRTGDAGFSLVCPLDGLKKITRQTGLAGGFTLELGTTGSVGGGTIPYRLSCSFNDFPGREVDAVQDTLMGVQVAGELLTPLGGSRFTLSTGASLNGWRWDHQEPGFHDTQSIKGVKFGGRLGLDFRVSPRFSVLALLQLTELGTDRQAIYGYNPSWLQVGARYHF